MMVAAASPRFSPQRSMSNGRHSTGDRALSDPKPLTMKRDCTSAPQTMAVSQ